MPPKPRRRKRAAAVGHATLAVEDVAELNTRVEEYLQVVSLAPMPCPLCDRVVRSRQRAAVAAADQPERSERTRRRDHMRKCHGMLFCDRCSKRFPKSALAKHRMTCTGAGPSPTGSPTATVKRRVRRKQTVVPPQPARAPHKRMPTLPSEHLGAPALALPPSFSPVAQHQGGVSTYGRVLRPTAAAAEYDPRALGGGYRSPSPGSTGSAGSAQKSSPTGAGAGLPPDPVRPQAGANPSLSDDAGLMFLGDMWCTGLDARQQAAVEAFVKNPAALLPCPLCSKFLPTPAGGVLSTPATRAAHLRDVHLLERCDTCGQTVRCNGPHIETCRRAATEVMQQTLHEHATEGLWMGDAATLQPSPVTVDAAASAQDDLNFLFDGMPPSPPLPFPDDTDAFAVMHRDTVPTSGAGAAPPTAFPPPTSKPTLYSMPW